MSSIPNPPEHTNENTTNTATHTRIGTRFRPSCTSVISHPLGSAHADPAATQRGAPGLPQTAHTILLLATRQTTIIA